ncbi:aminotransferase class V-fold PLP-dependent enzyme [Salinisphaera sp. Q1T1-3]|uniref:aminotransferase class V-fold PLP-dependent enzyme n=1 Tax=Salinisphaera sp. Q1T1-3 TaxID=2321229 RepID=UPI000E711F7F|nr:SufS family cysteine desulfurase [Salinisphaera sp. Q1T1-3]RJS95315.1 SufS family cysteine desulfurase [Salinisphaera sp. Q1T1-3]
MSQVQPLSAMKNGFDAERVRRDFPILEEALPSGQRLVYLDNAATTQKPAAVLDASDAYYRHANANVHRAIHTLSQRATAQYEGARDKAAAFLGAASRDEIVYTSGTTDGINLVAQCFARPRLSPGDEILLTELEHHSNIVPWQMIAEITGAKVVVVPIGDDGSVSLADFKAHLSSKTVIAAFAHISNSLGTVLPVADMIEAAHAAGATTLIDGAQAVAHAKVDVQALDADFYVMSAHKLFGPTGFGVLYGKKTLLEDMPPYQGGGDMIEQVSFAGTTYNDVPYKFEAGTPNIAGAAALGAAIDYVSQFDMGEVFAHEHELLTRATEAMQAIDGLRIVGTAPGKAGIISFVMDGVHAHDIGTLLDESGIAIRTGHHCAMPVMERFQVAATARVSFGLYNTDADVDALIAGLESIQRIFG